MPDLDQLMAAMSEAVATGNYAQAYRLSLQAVKAARLPERPARSQRPRCDAITRKGERCKAPAVWIPGEAGPRNGKCRLHGGLSTGPKTLAGKALIAASNRRRAELARTRKGMIDALKQRMSGETP